MQYVITLAQKVLEAAGLPDCRVDGLDMLQLLNLVVEELERLSPLDFVPGERYNFVTVRSLVRAWRNYGGLNQQVVANISALMLRLLPVLNGYSPEQPLQPSRSFAFMKDPDLQSIVERDYSELTLRLFPSGAWKSTVVLAGSILEALLYDQLTAPANVARANAASAAPTDKRTGKVKDLCNGDWTLAELIVVATELSLLGQKRSDTVDQVLRDYRNFVHPKKEVRSGHSCGDAEAFLAIGALRGVIDSLT